jgi:beta-N-acetylglucosaminidase/uncharacterized protein YggL (DUF469 family)
VSIINSKVTKFLLFAFFITVLVVFNNSKVLADSGTLLVRGNIDAPVASSTIKEVTTVRGWVLDGSGVAKVEILVDGRLVGQAQYGLSRPDVKNVFPQYQNASSGFQFSLDTRKFLNGTHSITVNSTGTNGTTTTIQSKSVNIQNLPVIGNIDTPTSGSTVKGVTNVRGWVLDGSEVAKVEVLVDGKITGQAQYGLSRPDVQKVIPQYQNANSGFQFALDTKKISNGNHSITVLATGKNGATTEIQRIMLNVQNLPPIGNVDSPTADSLINGLTNISGWFLDGSGIAKIDVLVDGKVIGPAQYGISRPDVQKVIPQYQNANSGFEYMLNTKNLTNGIHSIIVRATGNNGTTKELQGIKVNVQNLPHLPTIGNIDTPSAGSIINGVTNIRGWYLDGSGVAKIDVLIDGKIYGQAQYGISRPDVKSVFPEYFNGNAGFHYSLDTKLLTDGQHTLTISEISKSGATNPISVNFTVNNGNPYLTLNLKKPANITAADIVTFFNLKSPNSPLKNYAQAFIDAQNQYGVNAQYLVAHAIWETGWNGSDLRNYKYNLFGYGAYDVCPFTCGYYFPSGPDSIFKVAYQVRRNYLDSTGSYYVAAHGPTLIGMNVRYATDQNWKNGIANLMKSMKVYDHSYYSNEKELSLTAAAPPDYGRDIPAGQPYPVNTIINFPSGIAAKIVNTTSLTFRSLPYVATSTVSGSLPQNTVITILGYNTDVLYNPTHTGNYAYRWYRVKVNGQNGWLYGGYLSIENLAQVSVAGGTLNIRSSTSSATSSNILTSVNNGTYLKTCTQNGVPVTENGWYKVYLPNSSTTGWIFGDYVKQVKQ